MSKPFHPQASGLLTYPTQSWHKAIYKWPVQLWRLGLGPIIGQVMMIITHTGRKSGLPRRTMVEHYWQYGHPYVFSGWGDKSQWVKNLLADPRCTIQTTRGSQSARAVRLTEEADLRTIYHLFMRRNPPLTRQMLQMYEIAEDPDDFVAKKERFFCFRFEPTDEPTPRPLESDLVWLWPAVGALSLVLWLLKKSSHSA